MVLTEQAVSDYLNKTLLFNNSDFSKQWDYENPETGVYFLIDWNEPNTDKDDIEIWDSFSEFEYLNFSFSINFCRPNYFGMEIFPIIEKMADDLDLYLLNSQKGSEEEMPQKFAKGYLQDQWIRQNDQISVSNFEKFELKFMPPDKSTAMWWYNLHRQEIENGLTEDIFVPRFFIHKYQRRQ